MLDGVVIVDFCRYINGVVVNHTGECLCLGEMVLEYLRVKGQIDCTLSRQKRIVYQDIRK